MSGSTDDGLRTVIDSVDLLNIYALKLAGSRTSGRQVTQFAFVVHPQWQRNEDQLDYRFDVRCEPQDEDGEAVALIEYSVVCSYEVLDTDALESVADEDLTLFGANVVLYAAYPYLREGVQSVADRLGMNDISLGMLRRNRDLPVGMSFGDLSRASGQTADE